MTLNAEQALRILTRMQSAAPAPTAAKIAEVAMLIESLNRDNTFLEALHSKNLSNGAPQVAQFDDENAINFDDDSLLIGLPSSAPEAPDPEEQEKEPPDPDSIHLSDIEGVLVHLDEAIRFPLETVRNQINNVIAGSIGRFTSEQYSVFEDIAANNACALSLLDNVTQMIALHHGLLEVDTLIFSCPLLVREAQDTAEQWVKARDQHIELRLPDAVLQAEGDYQRVLAILVDMLHNASRYSPPYSTIVVSVEDLGSHVLFSVADQGIGLSEDDLAHVGEPFWRAHHQERVRQQPGTGLRLYLARALLALQGGELIFSGEEEVGSTFSFTLPAANPS